jgi:hypothetical protein
MKDALNQIGSPKRVLTQEEIARLLPYYEGIHEIPPKTSPNGSELWNELALYQDQLRAAHEKQGDAWMKDPQNKSRIDHLATLHPRGREFKPLGLPFTPKGSDVDDLPEIPPFLALAMHDDQSLEHGTRNLAQKARDAFILALKGASFKDTPEGKLCQIFAKLFQERNKLHIDAHDVRMKNQFTNAALALLAYKIIYPLVQKRKMGDGSSKERVGFGINLNLLDRHAEVFLAKERWDRLEKKVAQTNDPAEKAHLVQELNALKEKKDDADTFLSNIAKNYGIKQPLTIFESFGNRLYVRASYLPVFDTPQTADAQPGRAIASRSLDAALKMLSERERINEAKFRSDDLTERSAEFSNILQSALNSTPEYENALRQFKEGIADADTLFVARGILKELIDRVADLRRVENDTVATLNPINKSPQSITQRKAQFEPIQELATKVLLQYEKLLSELGTMVFPSSTSNKALTREEFQQTVANVIEADRLAAFSEIRDNRELLESLMRVPRGKLARENPIAALQEIEAIIGAYLAARTVIDKKD